jgi:hypothetical protein
MPNLKHICKYCGQLVEVYWCANADRWLFVQHGQQSERFPLGCRGSQTTLAPSGQVEEAPHA